MLLAILKLILNIIKFLLLTVLLLVLLLLFSRLKYNISGKYKDEIELNVRLSYLFGLLRLSYQYGGEGEGLKIILPFGIGSKNKEKSSKINEESESEYVDAAWLDEKWEVDLSEEETINISENTAKAVSETVSEDVSKDVSDTVSKNVDEFEPKKKKTANKTKKKPKKKAEKKESIFTKIENGRNRLIYMNDRYDFALLVRYIFRFIGEQLRSIGIQGGSVEGELGLSDPSQTGLALGGIGAARAFLPLDIDIEGNFAEKTLAIEGKVYGKTYLGKLLRPALRLLLTRPVLLIIKDILFTKGDK